MNSVTPITSYSQKDNFNNITKPNFKAKKIPAKGVLPENVLNAMGLMSVPLTAFGITANVQNRNQNPNRISNTEFKKIKAEISEKMEAYGLDYNFLEINKNNCLLILKLLDNPVFKADAKNCEYILSYTDCQTSKEQLAKVKLLETVGKDSELLDQHDIYHFVNSWIKKDKDTENIIQLYNYVANNKDFYNYLITNNDCITYHNYRYGFSTLCEDLKDNPELLPRVLEDENLKNNANILFHTNYVDDKNYELVLDTLSARKELLSNKNVINQLKGHDVIFDHVDALSFNKILNIEDENIINNILINAKNVFNSYMDIPQERKYHMVFDALMNTNELYKNKDISENLYAILTTKPRAQSITSVVIAIINKIDSSPELCQNQELMNNIGKILASIKTRDKGEQILYNLNNICPAYSEQEQLPDKKTTENCIKKYGASMEKIEKLKNVSQSRYRSRIARICKELKISEDALNYLVKKYNIT